MDEKIGFGCFLWTIIAILFIGIFFLIPAIELWLWGIVMVPAFGAPMLTYWQMLALNWLIHLLFNQHITFNSNNSSKR